MGKTGASAEGLYTEVASRLPQKFARRVGERFDLEITGRVLS
jgi:hypothetical protein